jgi:hypothetical protein
MMGIFHRNQVDFEILLFRHSYNFIGSVVRHQKIALDFSAFLEKFVVVDLTVCIKPRSGAFAGCGIRRVNEERGCRARGVLLIVSIPSS